MGTKILHPSIQKIMAKDMPPDVISYIFSIWIDCIGLDHLHIDMIGLLRQISSHFNEKCQPFTNKSKIAKLLRFDLAFDKIDHHTGSIYAISRFTTKIASPVGTYIGFCKSIICSRPIRYVDDIIRAIKLAWMVDIIPFNQIYGLGASWWMHGNMLSGLETVDHGIFEGGSSTLTGLFILEIFGHIIDFRNNGFTANKHRNQLESERNEIAILHNNRIYQWRKALTRSTPSCSSCMDGLYQSWIYSEIERKHDDWTSRSADLRCGTFVAKLEYYFKNHWVSF